MSGYVVFWSKEYIKKLEKAKDSGPFCVVYGSQHTKMPDISSLRVGDIVYPVALRDGTLCVMARLPVEKIEPAYDYIMQNTGQRHAALIPKGILMREKGPLSEKYGSFYIYSEGSGYENEVELPQGIHTVVQEDELAAIPHKFHQEPITCCASLAASGAHGSDIRPRMIPLEQVGELRFGKTKSTQKPLRTDKNGSPTSISLSGFVRKMSDDTFEFFEKLF